MKVLLFLKLWLAVCLLAVSTVSLAAITWESTDGDSNFISFVSGTFPSPSNEIFGIFSATANLAVDTPVYTFTGVGSFSSASSFKLGLQTTSGWIGEDSYSVFGAPPNTYLLSFATSGFTSYLWGIDLQPAADHSSGTSVPLPASAWFMTSIWLGVLYIGRRKVIDQA